MIFRPSGQSINTFRFPLPSFGSGNLFGLFRFFVSRPAQSRLPLPPLPQVVRARSVFLPRSGLSGPDSPLFFPPVPDFRDPTPPLFSARSGPLRTIVFSVFPPVRLPRPGCSHPFSSLFAENSGALSGSESAPLFFRSISPQRNFSLLSALGLYLLSPALPVVSLLRFLPPAAVCPPPKKRTQNFLSPLGI